MNQAKALDIIAYILRVVQSGSNDFCLFGSNDTDAAAVKAITVDVPAQKKMVIAQSVVTVDGQTGWSSRGSESFRKALIILSEKVGGRYISLREDEILKRIGIYEPIRQAIRAFRVKAGDGVLLSDSSGYRLHESVSVEIVADKESGLTAGQNSFLKELQIGNSRKSKADVMRASSHGNRQAERDLSELENAGHVKRIRVGRTVEFQIKP